ncbi:MAG: isochorismatase family cysteine hydrolase [Chloroflexota bacterium]
MGNTGLVVIDMLKDFVEGVLANPASRPTIDPIEALVKKARQRKDWRVIYANDAHLPGDLELEVFGEHAMAGSAGAAVVEQLKPIASDFVVPKRFYSSFTQTDLEATCRVHDIDTLVLVGQHTDCCVRHTSYDAFQLGIKLIVPSDATAIFSPASEEPEAIRQQRALDYLKTFYAAKIVTSRDLF